MPFIGIGIGWTRLRQQLESVRKSIEGQIDQDMCSCGQVHVFTQGRQKGSSRNFYLIDSRRKVCGSVITLSIGEYGHTALGGGGKDFHYRSHLRYSGAASDISGD